MKKSKYTSLLLGAVMGLALSSCGIYSTYHRPDSITAEGLYRDSLQADTTRNIADLSWREIFTDPGLQSLIETGLRQNTDLRIARLRVEEAAASLRSAQLAFLPGLSFAPEGGISSLDGAQTNWTHSEMFSASWELDFFGRMRNAKRQARAQMEQSMDYQQAVRTGLISTVAINYYTLVMLHRQLDVSQQTLANWQENVRAMTAMKRAGLVNEAALSQAAANALAVEAAVADLKQQITELENNFSVLLGNVPQEIKVDKAKIQPLSLTAYGTGISAELLANRPDVRQAENALKAAFYNTNAARSAFYPSVTLNGSLGWTNSGGGTIVNPAQVLASAVGTLVQPLFARGRLRAGLKIAKAQQEEAKLQFIQSLLDAGAEVNNALSACQTACRKRELYDRQILRLENTVHSTRLLMQNSASTTYLEVLTAQQSLLEAKLTRIMNEFEESQGIITLYRALGGGRETIDVLDAESKNRKM